MFVTPISSILQCYNHYLFSLQRPCTFVSQRLVIYQAMQRFRIFQFFSFCGAPKYLVRLSVSSCFFYQAMQRFKIFFSFSVFVEYYRTVISLFLNFEIIMPKRRGSSKINNKREELVGKLASGKQLLY